MKPWDIYTYDFQDAGPHPAVIVSHPDRVTHAARVNVLICTTQRASRPPKEHEVRLNGVTDWIGKHCAAATFFGLWKS